MEKNKKRECSAKGIPLKSLKSRIRFIVNISILSAVVLVCTLLFLLINIGFNKLSNETSYLFIEDIQEIMDDITMEAKTLYGDEFTDANLTDLFKSKHIYKDKMDKLFNRIPVFSTSITLLGEEIYQLDAEKIVEKIINNEDSFISDKTQERIESNSDSFEFQGNYTKADLTDYNGCVIGEINIGVDNRIEYGLYIAFLGAVILIGIVVIILMRFVTGLFLKPILNPIYKLQEQLDQLADENYENINPTVIVNKRAVREVKALSEATNRLLTKMINYNEVITQSEKMASVGQLTAAITHEINTPLGVINSNAGLMKMLAEAAVSSSEEDEKQTLLETIGETADTTEEACSRIQVIIKSLRSYSRIDQADFMPASINESMKSVVTLTTNLHKNRIKIIEDFGIIPDVLCYIGLINQVFMNLVINAIQAIEGEGTITLRTIADDEFVYASVIDTGCGIKSKYMYRVFEYGFTTKQPGSGSGIGLALSKNIINKHKGEILIDSNEGEGATITVKLPIDQ